MAGILNRKTLEMVVRGSRMDAATKQKFYTRIAATEGETALRTLLAEIERQDKAAGGTGWQTK